MVTAIDALRIAFRMLYKEGRTQTSRLERIEADHGTILEVVEFLDHPRVPDRINTAREGPGDAGVPSTRWPV